MKLNKTLNFRDIVFLNITAIIGLRWISLSASNGNISILLWLLALLLFFLPQAFAVMELTSRLPGEGGIYLWTKTAFGDFHGFLSGWCYWTNNLIYFPNLLVYIAGVSVFVAGDEYQAYGENKTYILLFSLTALWVVMLFNFLGLKFGRWVNNVGGFGTWLTGTILILLGITVVIKFGFANPMPVGSFFSGINSFDNLTFWASICFGFSGLEVASILAGETKNPEKTIPRAVIVSGVIIALIYILGTLALLAALPQKDINIVTGFLQGIAAVSYKLGMGWMSQIIALLITLGGIGGLMAWFTSAARMPFVAGVDNFLPVGFSKIHPRFGTPYIAIIAQTIAASVFILMSFIGASVEEAYLILLDTTLLVYFIPYVYMFLSYIILRNRNIGTGKILLVPKNDYYAYIFGVCGLLTTLLAMGLSLVPFSGTANVFLYEVKVIGGFLLFVLTGVIIFRIQVNKK